MKSIYFADKSLKKKPFSECEFAKKELSDLKGIWVETFGFVFENETMARKYVERMDGKIAMMKMDRILIDVDGEVFVKMVIPGDKTIGVMKNVIAFEVNSK